MQDWENINYVFFLGDLDQDKEAITRQEEESVGSKFKPNQEKIG